MKKNIMIEDKLFPDRNKLYKDKSDTYVTTIVDAELDEIECKFNYDDCAELNTNNYEYLTLTKENLLDLIKLIDKSTDLYNKQFELINEKAH